MTEFFQARILLLRQRILCRDRFLAKLDKFYRDITFCVSIEPAAT